MQRPQHVEHRVESPEIAGLHPVPPRGAQIAEVGFQFGEGLRPLLTGQALPLFDRDVGEVLRVCAPSGATLLRQLIESLGCVVADRLEHREPAVTVLVEAADEALVDERYQPWEHARSCVVAQPSGDRLHRFDAGGCED